ncbi:MAG: ATP-binding protein [Gemmatimonadales bacterium]
MIELVRHRISRAFGNWPQSPSVVLLAGVLFVLPGIHPLLRAFVGEPSHLLWFVHVLPVALAAFAWGITGALAVIPASVLLVMGGELVFGAGYGSGADVDTVVALGLSVGLTEILVAAFAIRVRSAERLGADLRSLAITALGSSTVAMFIVEQDGRIRYSNSAANDLFSGGVGNLVGKDISSVVGDELMSTDVCCSAGTRQVVARATTGRLFPAEFHMSPIRTDGEEPSAWLLSVHDRTDELKKEEGDRRARALSELGSVAAGIAHELNNPLTSVATYGELLSDFASSLDLEVAELVDAMVHESRRASQIGRQLLKRVRKEGKDREPFDVNAVVREALASRRRQFVAHGVRVEASLSHEVLPVVGDAGEIEQIIVNLFANAEFAMYDANGGGVLRVTTALRENLVELCIEDNGPGIPPEILPNVLEPFVSTKGDQGTGLGLAIARRIARSHGGELEAGNVPTGGATFRLTLPTQASLKLSAPAGERPDASLWPAGRRVRVLIVDDERGIRHSVGRLLTRRGLEVETVDNVPAALEKIDSGPLFDAIFCDFHLAGATGISLYNELCKRDPLLAKRFVLMTGDILGADASRFLEETGCPYLAKPFEANELVALAHRLAA